MSRKNILAAKLISTLNNNGKLQETSLAADIDVGGVEGYADTNALPENPSLGDLALVTSTNTLYVYNGSAWFNIAIANQAPTAITGNQASYELAIDGTPTVVTLVSTDPEGFPLTWSSSVSGDTQVGTVVQADNVFTVTPSSDEADIGTLSITFSVTDGNNTENSTSTFTLAFMSPLWDETVLSIGTSSTNSLNNSTFIDRSTNAHTVTPTGSPVQTSFHPYLENWSVGFSQGYQRFLQNTSIPGMGTSDFTIEAWIWHNGDLSENQTIFANAGTTSASVSSISFQLQTNGYLQLGRYFKGNSTGTTAVPANQWVHVAVERSGSNVYLYVNGQQESKTIAADESYGFTGGFRIGEHWGTSVNSGAPFGGYISNLRVVKGSLVYNGSFTPPTEKLTPVTNTILLTCQDNRFKDNSTNGYEFTINDTNGESSHHNPKISSFNPFGQESEYDVGENKGSYYYNDNSPRLDISNIPSIPGDFTIEGWIYPIQKGANDTIFELASYSNGVMLRCGTGAYSNFYVNGTSVFPSRTEIAVGEWHHFAIVRSGTTVTLYKNGQSLATSTVSGNIGSGDLRIGDSRNSPGQTFFGYISDFKVSIGTAAYTSNFTAPTAPVGNTNASLYLPMDNAGIFDKTGNHALTLVGNTSTSTTQTKYADTAIYFDGSGDYIKSTDKFQLFPDVVSIEFWLYAITDGEMLGNRATITTYGPLDVALSGGRLRMWSSGGSAWNLINGDFGPQTTADLRNAWHHVAIVRNGTDFKVFIDGVADYTATLSSSASGVSNEYLYIGATAGNSNAAGMFQGYLEDLQILKGTVKYTTDFTPPTKTQGISYQAES